jgi:hypothetical protein
MDNTEELPPIPEYPKIEWQHTTHACGSDVNRWAQRRAILIAQRDYRLVHLRMVESLKARGVPNLDNAIERLEQPLEALNTKIEECNTLIDTLSAGKKPLKGQELKKVRNA